MDIVLASRNAKKIRELETLLSDLSSKSKEPIRILSLDQIGFTEEVEETGATFEENACIKAEATAKLGYVTVADDSGLTVDALNGAPGVYSARYSGGGDAENNKKLLCELENVADEDRTARFVTSVVCMFGTTGEKIVCHGQCEGMILREKRGENGFGYDPLFYYPPYGKTFAEMDADEKNAISHRGKAMRQFGEELARWLEKTE